MDYQAGTSSKIKHSLGFFRNTALTIIVVGVLFLFSGDHVVAQVAENPLSVTVSIDAYAPWPIIPPQEYPDVKPIPNPGPINMVDTVDSVIFKGLAYPNAKVYVVKNGETLGETTANTLGQFDIRLRGLTQGTFSFGIRAEDLKKNTSKLLTFSVFISGGVATLVDGIFIPPTITSDKVEVKKGDTITFSGASAPNTEVRISLGKGQTELFKRVQSGASGLWDYVFTSSELTIGDYDAKARAIISDNLSPFSDVLAFRIGDTNRLRAKVSDLFGFRKKCDLNNDNKVNLLDFSIMAFWYKRIGFPPKVDLNTDTQVNLTDLSILAYCWTG